jgi:hypothetical protein
VGLNDLWVLDFHHESKGRCITYTL